VRIFRHPVDRVPVALIVLLFAVDLAIYATCDAWPLLVGWTLVGAVIKGHVCAWNHHHQHVPMFEVEWLNRLLEVVFALQTGVTSQTWVLHHTLGHHVNYLDQRADESRWAREDGTTMGALEYTAVVAATAYRRAYDVGQRFPRQRRIFLGMGVLTLAIVAGLIAWRPLPALFVFVLPMAISLLITVWATHSHHAGKPVTSHFVACNNIIHRGYNLLTGNLGYHTAHHHKPGVHWSKLPALHDAIAHRIPADCYLTPGFPWRLGQTTAEPPERVLPCGDAPDATLGAS
jgi:fatty acid desaturase